MVDTASKRTTAEVGEFVSSLVAAAATPSGSSMIYDSAAGASFTKEAMSRGADVKGAIPAAFAPVFDEFDGDGEVTKAILDSAAIYQKEHGCAMPADLAHQALHNALSVTEHGRAQFKGMILDSAGTSSAHAPTGYQPNRAAIAILSATGEAAPFIHHLPTDIGSNKAILAILSHHAGNKAGQYAANDLMDGIHAGKRFLSAIRTNTSYPDDAGAIGGKITAFQTGVDTCDQDAPGIKTLRGRLEVFINGFLAAREAEGGGAGNNAVNGKLTISGVEYVIGGVHNSDTGIYALATVPALPKAVAVVVAAPIDFEKQPELMAETATGVEIFSLYAHVIRGRTFVTPEAQTQMMNELGLDPFSENVLAFQRQLSIERHYDALNIVQRLSVNNHHDYKFDYEKRSTDMTRAKMWGDFASTLGACSQQMVENTMDHGLTHLYVPKLIKAEWEALPRELFEPSGTTSKAGIHRIGRFAGQYDVYYNPRGKENMALGSAQILGIGKASTAARNCVVAGDAVAPAVRPLAITGDLNQGAGFFGRSFLSVSPHHPSAMGAAQLNITGLKAL